MSKGTPSQGKRNKITHIPCRRCGRPSYHVRHKTCAKCGYPKSKTKKYNWAWKSVLTRLRKK